MAAGNLIDSQKALLDQNSKLKEQFAKTKQVLENYSNSQARLGVLQKKIGEEAKKRETMMNAMTKFAFATDKDRLSIVKNFQAATIAAANGLQAIPEDMRPAVMGVFDQFKNVRMFGGKTGKEAKQDLTIKEIERVFGPMTAAQKKQLLDSTTAEEAFLKKMDDIQKEAVTAQIAMLDGMKDDRSRLTSEIARLHGELVAGLSNIFLKQEQKRVEQQLNEMKLSNKTQQEQLTALTDLSNAGMQVKNPDVLKAMQENIGVIKGLKEAREERTKIRALKDEKDVARFGGPLGKETGGVAVEDVLKKMEERLKGTQGRDEANRMTNVVRQAINAARVALPEGETLSAARLNEIAEGAFQSELTLREQEQSSIISSAESKLDMLGSAVRSSAEKMIAGVVGGIGMSFEDASKKLNLIPKGATFASLTTEVGNSTAGLANLNTELANVTGQIQPGVGGVAPARGGLIGQGVVFAAGGMFVKKGTDTVPAMLTPGEFVVNKKATSQNKGMLNSINSGGAQYFSLGGQVGANSAGPKGTGKGAVIEALADIPAIFSAIAVPIADQLKTQGVPKEWIKAVNWSGVSVPGNNFGTFPRYKDSPLKGPQFAADAGTKIRLMDEFAGMNSNVGTFNRDPKSILKNAGSIGSVGGGNSWAGIEKVWKIWRYMVGNLTSEGTGKNSYIQQWAKQDPESLAHSFGLRKTGMASAVHGAKDAFSLGQASRNQTQRRGNMPQMWSQFDDAFAFGPPHGGNFFPKGLQKKQGWLTSGPGQPVGFKWPLPEFREYFVNPNTRGDNVPNPMGARANFNTNAWRLLFPEADNIQGFDLSYTQILASRHEKMMAEDVFSQYKNQADNFTGERAAMRQTASDQILSWGNDYTSWVTGVVQSDKDMIEQTLAGGLGGATLGSAANSISGFGLSLDYWLNRVAHRGQQDVWGVAGGTGLFNALSLPMAGAGLGTEAALGVANLAALTSLKYDPFTYDTSGVVDAKAGGLNAKMLDFNTDMVGAKPILDNAWNQLDTDLMAGDVDLARDSWDDIADMLGLGTVMGPMVGAGINIQAAAANAAVAEQERVADRLEDIKEKKKVVKLMTATGVGDGNSSIVKAMGQSRQNMLASGFRRRTPRYAKRGGTKGSMLHRIDANVPNAMGLFPWMMNTSTFLSDWKGQGAMSAAGPGNIAFDPAMTLANGDPFFNANPLGLGPAGANFADLERLSSTPWHEWANVLTTGGMGGGMASTDPAAEAEMMKAYFGTQPMNDIAAIQKGAKKAVEEVKTLQGFATGGTVGLSGGGAAGLFTPQGTDTVPAMLTPGEFVVRKTAVDAVGTEFLHALNSASSGKSQPIKRKDGGGVQHLARGGGVGRGRGTMLLDSSKFEIAVRDFSREAEKLADVFRGGMSFFHDGTITIKVDLGNGAELFAAAEGSMKRIAAEKVAGGINNMLKDKFPDLPRMGMESFGGEALS